MLRTILAFVLAAKKSLPVLRSRICDLAKAWPQCANQIHAIAIILFLTRLFAVSEFSHTVRESGF